MKKDYDTALKQIHFIFKEGGDKKVKFILEEQEIIAENDDYVLFCFTPEEIEAIYKQVKSLGWLEGRI